MERMGHSTSRAALVYLHSTDERQRKVADALGELARAELQDERKRASARGASGADLARKAAKRHQLSLMSDANTVLDLVIYCGAPSATRTRDLLLRRRFPNVA
jgi:hypothetical protein